VSTNGQTDDVQAIKKILARQLENISLSAEKESDWEQVAHYFIPDASLYPAARPAKA